MRPCCCTVPLRVSGGVAWPAWCSAALSSVGSREVLGAGAYWEVGFEDPGAVPCPFVWSVPAGPPLSPEGWMLVGHLLRS